MIGLLAQGPMAPAAAFADEWAHGADALAASGAMWARLPGETGGAGGLGLTGIGEGGGGSGRGIGLGFVGTLGHGDGLAGPGTGGEGSSAGGVGWSGDWGGSGVGHMRAGTIRHGVHLSRPPTYRCGWVSVSGRLPPEAIQRIVRQNFGRFRACYQAGLARNPNLAGTVTTRFVIDRSGAVSNAANGGSDLPDPTVAACVTRAFSGVSFPQPEGGIVTVTYPIQFSRE